MTNYSLIQAFIVLKNSLVYKPSENPKPFVLDEVTRNTLQSPSALQDASDDLDATLRLARRVATALDQTKTVISSDPSPDKIKAVQKELKSLEAQTKEISPIRLSFSNEAEVGEPKRQL